MSDWAFLEKHRCCEASRLVPQHLTSDETYGFNGMFRFTMDGHNVRCVASDGLGWQHVSVTLEFERKTPSWTMMTKIKDLFWEDDDVVVQFHPKRKDYVNYHSYCLHLWRCTKSEFPTPESILVGPKAVSA